MIRSLDASFVQSIITNYGDRITKLNLADNGLENIELLPEISTCFLKLNLSKNKLRDIQSLGKINTLNELNLSENQITDINALEPLDKLELLNLQGNSISSLKQLMALKSMTNLKQLNLFANPICLTLVYPIEIFRLQPNLQQIDDWTRDQCMSNLIPVEPMQEFKDNTIQRPSKEPQTNNSQALVSKDIPISSRTSQPFNNELMNLDHMKAFEVQIEAMNNAFVLQEQALETNGKEALKYCLQRNLLASKDDSSLNIEQVVGEFPYIRLLEAWRSKVMRLLMENIHKEQHLQTFIHTSKQDREQLTQKLHEQERQGLKYKEQFIAIQSQNQQLTQHLYELKQLYLHEQQQFQQQIHHLQQYQIQSKQLQALFPQIKRTIDTNQLSYQGILWQFQEKCSQYEQKIIECTNQCMFLKDLWQEKELSMRNTLAMMEAKHQLDLLQYQQPVNTSSSVLSIENNQSKPHKPSILQHLQLSSEQEMLLKTIFQQIDHNSEGKITSKLLLICLLPKCLRHFFWLIIQKQAKHVFQAQTNNQPEEQINVFFHQIREIFIQYFLKLTNETFDPQEIQNEFNEIHEIDDEDDDEDDDDEEEEEEEDESTLQTEEKEEDVDDECEDEEDEIEEESWSWSPVSQLLIQLLTPDIFYRFLLNIFVEILTTWMFEVRHSSAISSSSSSSSFSALVSLPEVTWSQLPKLTFTWAEFLLFFLPRSNDEFTHPMLHSTSRPYRLTQGQYLLSSQEIHEMSQPSTHNKTFTSPWDFQHFGCLPLAIPKQDFEQFVQNQLKLRSDSNPKSISSSSGKLFTKQEQDRILQERNYLLYQLSSYQKQQIYWIEQIKLYYQHQLNNYELQLSQQQITSEQQQLHYQQQCQYLQQSETLLQTKYQQVLTQKEHYYQQLLQSQDELQQLQHKYTQLTSQLETNHGTNQELQQLFRKNQQLEEENVLLTREKNKQAVMIRSLQHDILSNQKQLTKLLQNQDSNETNTKQQLNELQQQLQQQYEVNNALKETMQEKETQYLLQIQSLQQEILQTTKQQQLNEQEIHEKKLTEQQHVLEMEELKKELMKLHERNQELELIQSISPPSAETKKGLDILNQFRQLKSSQMSGESLNSTTNNTNNNTNKPSLVGNSGSYAFPSMKSDLFAASSASSLQPNSNVSPSSSFIQPPHTPLHTPSQIIENNFRQTDISSQSNLTSIDSKLNKLLQTMNLFIEDN